MCVHSIYCTDISAIYAPEEMVTKALSPLTEVSSARSKESDTRDSGLDTLHRSRKSGDMGRSVVSLPDTLGLFPSYSICHMSRYFIVIVIAYISGSRI